MQWLDLLHRWLGGLLGLILAVLGITGTLLLHKEEWITLPHAHSEQLSDPGAIARMTGRLLGDAQAGETLIYASDRFGLVQTRLPEGSGAYWTQSGLPVANWDSQWERPELWLFDLHHHLFAGETGEILVGAAGLGALFFIVTGTVLWWRTRRTFRFRLWPARFTRPAIIRHHRDLGVMISPVLFVISLTGVMLIFRPVADLVLAPVSPPGTVETSLKPPKLISSPLAARPDWSRIIHTAYRRFPDARIRILSLPRKAGEPITIRMKQSAEWLPNGRTMLWFDAGSGKLLAARDALSVPAAAQMFNALYPLHAAKVGGLPYRLILTLCGMALTLLGTLAVWTFWFRKPSRSGTRPVDPA